MNLFIYVLLLSIWTNSCLYRNESNGSATSVATHVESRQRRIEGTQQWLVLFIIVILIICFILRCYCFIHYSCVDMDASKAAMVKKEDSNKASTSCKISFTESKSPTAGPGNPEKQSLLSSIDKSSGPSSPQKASVPSSTEKLVRLLSQQNPFKPSVLGSLFQEKLCRTRSPKKAHRWAHAHKLVDQVSPAYAKKAIKPTWPSSLQCPVKPIKMSPPYPKSQSVPKQSSIAKLTKLQKYLKLRRPASEGRAKILSRPQPVKFCQCYKEKCIVCNAVSEPFITPSEENMKYVPVPLSSGKLKCLYKSSHKTEPKDNALYGNMNDSHLSAYSSDSESDREMIIMHNIKCKEATYKTSQNN
ncbi:uncharacterized protein CXorf66 homolog [Oryx dammah]|uniref:uncharacterized protein CXorf66 homolog n=1 Tax=Oryx dammah TaxID=59534 RepID=UPI001A9B3C16|nr:uncharacterized protein CXorf66 homolog [Oryx dammah]